MARRQYLVSYDISNDKRRNRVFKTLMGQGEHLRYSVFLYALNRQELIGLRADSNESIHQRDDQVLFVDLGESDRSLDGVLECLG